VQAFHKNNDKKASDGERKFSFSRGRSFIVLIISLISSFVTAVRCIFFGKYCRINLFVFSLKPLSQEE